jgi:hypothetical protein
MMRVTSLIMWLRQIMVLSWRFWLASSWGLLLVWLAFRWFEPMYGTNDDVGMAMRVHGFGQYAEASPFIVYSNVIWGWILFHLPTLNHVYAYAWVTVLIMLAYTWGLTYFGLRSAAPIWLVLPLVAAIVAEPLLFPQFTKHAVFLSLVMALAIRQYMVSPAPWLLVVVVVFGIAGMLVRTYGWLAVAMYMVPLLSWRKFWADMRLRWVGIGLIGFLIISVLINWVAYQTTAELRQFESLYRLYQPIFNNNATLFFEQNPQMLTTHGWHENDIQLIRSRFLIPGRLMDADALRDIMSNVPRLNSEIAQKVTFMNFKVVATVAPWLLYVGLGLVLVSKQIRLWGVFAAFIIGEIGLGILGREAYGRVTYPLLVVCVVFVLVSVPATTWTKHRWLAWVVVVCTAFGLWIEIPELASRSQKFTTHGAALWYDMHEIPNRPLVVWGGFEYEMMYPVRRIRDDVVNVPIYALALAAIEPTSVASKAVRQGFDIDTVLRSAAGLELITQPYQLPWLEQYCRDHHAAKMEANPSWWGATIVIYQVKCVP